MTIPLPPPNSASGGYLVPISPLPLDDEELGRRLSNLVAGVTGIPGNLVRPRWQKNPPPIPDENVDWVAVGVISYPSVHGTPRLSHHGEQEGYTVAQDPGQVNVLASFYGPNCSALARLCRTSLWVNQNWEQLAPLGLTLADVGDVTVTAELVNETWLRRADMPIFLAQTIDRTYAILNILSADGIIHASGSGHEVEVDFDTSQIPTPTPLQEDEPS
jgi:hypothetical protein